MVFEFDAQTVYEDQLKPHKKYVYVRRFLDQVCFMGVQLVIKNIIKTFSHYILKNTPYY